MTLVRVATVLVLAGVSLLGFAGYRTFLDHDIFDQFEVVSVLPHPTDKQNAIVAKYLHAETSARVTGIWIGSGERPQIGSRDVLRGNPAAIWTGEPQDLALAWQSDRLHVRARSKTAKVSHELQACLADWPVETADLCTDPAKVVIDAEQQE